MSHDDKFLVGGAKEPVAMRKVTVPYFDLALYGLEELYFSSESYGDGGDGNPGSNLESGTAETAKNKVTALHLFIYTLEKYYCGLKENEIGKGYLKTENLLGSSQSSGTVDPDGKILIISGSAGSAFMNSIWGYDLNLNYYKNYEYPLASDGWGATADQILLSNGDIMTLAHFTDWSFFVDSRSIFHYIKTAGETTETKAEITVKQGEKVNLEVYLAGSNMGTSSTTAQTPATYINTVYWAAEGFDNSNFNDKDTWTPISATNGAFTFDTSELDPGTYIVAVPGQKGEIYTDAICSAPGAIRVVVEESKVEAKPGDINGDDKINTGDAVKLCAFINGKIDLSNEEKERCDINGDGKINTGDAVKLCAFINGKIASLS